MRKLALVFAVAVTFGIVAGPFAHAVSAKTLWEGWVDEMKKAAEGVKKK